MILDTNTIKNSFGIFVKQMFTVKKNWVLRLLRKSIIYMLKVYRNIQFGPLDIKNWTLFINKTGNSY